MLSDKEIDVLTKELEKRGLTYTELQNELLDHLCCDIEVKMNEGKEFIKALEELKQGIGSDCIKQIQEDTLLLVNQKYRMMKKFMYILGTLAPTLVIIGTIFKINHWPGASITLTLGLFLLAAVYLPVFVSISIRDTRKKGKPVKKGIYIIGMVSGMIFIAGAMFKIMHWPGAGIMITLSAFVTVAVFIPMLVINALRDKENQVQNFTVLIFVLSFVAITFMSFALRVSKNVVDAFIIDIVDENRTEEVLSLSNDRALATVNSLDILEDQRSLSTNVAHKADEICSYIDDVIHQIILESHDDNHESILEDGSIDYWQIRNKDNAKIPATIMLGIDRDKAEGEIILNMLENYKQLCSEVYSMQENPVNSILNTSNVIENEYELSWVSYNFEHLPMISVISQLSSLKTKVRIIEGELLKK